MGTTEGIPTDDAGLLRRSLDGMPAGLMTIDAAGTLVQANTPVFEYAPSLTPGVNFREALEQLAQTEKVDRMLLRREVVSFPGTPGGPELHWMLWLEPNSHGEQVATFWEVDWSEEMYERRAAFTMAASHELRSPLTALRGFAEILNMDTGNLTPEQAEAAQIIEETARHLTVLVEDVFDLSRNSFGELTLNLCEIDPAAVVKSAVPRLKPRLEDRGQTLRCQIEESLPAITADEARVAQMVANLVNNASVHNGPGISVDLSARVAGDRVAVTVSDDGSGLPFEDPEEAFRSFRRGDAATEGDRSGSGIGLSVTRRLIELHRGEITVDAAPSGGASFTLWFPIDRENALEPGKRGPV